MSFKRPEFENPFLSSNQDVSWDTHPPTSGELVKGSTFDQIASYLNIKITFNSLHKTSFNYESRSNGLKINIHSLKIRRKQIMISVWRTILGRA